MIPLHRNAALISGLVGLIMGSCTPRQSFDSLDLSPSSIQGNVDSLFFTKFADEYIAQHLPLQADQKSVTILYPGSGADVTPLEIGFQILQKTKVETVHFIYTEISEELGDANSIPVFHNGFQDLTQRIDRGLEAFVKHHQFRVVRKGALNNHPWVQSPHLSTVFDYVLEVPVANRRKTITLTLGYNTFINRAEPSPEEKTSFSPALLQAARGGYWPNTTKKGKVYPTYFLQDQFDQADVLLSKSCGDFPLLQFDYVRALTKTGSHKHRAILTEHTNKLGRVQESIPSYHITVKNLSSHDYGYCAVFKECHVGVLGLTPRQN